MARLSKNRKLSFEKYDVEKIYSIKDASKLIKDISTTNPLLMKLMKIWQHSKRMSRD